MNLVNSEPHEAFITRCHARVRCSPPAMAAFLFRQAPGECLQRHSDYLFAAIFKEHLDTSSTQPQIKSSSDPARSFLKSLIRLQWVYMQWRSKHVAKLNHIDIFMIF